MTEEELVKLTLTLDESKNDMSSVEFAAELTGKSVQEIQEAQCFELVFNDYHKKKRVMKKLKNKMFFTESKEGGKHLIEVWSTLDFCMAYMIADALVWKKFKENPFTINPHLIEK